MRSPETLLERIIRPQANVNSIYVFSVLGFVTNKKGCTGTGNTQISSGPIKYQVFGMIQIDNLI